MGILKSIVKQITNDTGETEEEIRSKLMNSDFTALIATSIANEFALSGTDENGNYSSGGKFYNHLLGDTHSSRIWIKVYRNGIVTVMQHSTRVRNGMFSSDVTYEENTSGISFGKSGVADLPNDKYRKIMQDILLAYLKETLPNCYFVESEQYCGPAENPGITGGIVNNFCIKVTLSDTVKKGW